MKGPPSKTADPTGSESRMIRPPPSIRFPLCRAMTDPIRSLPLPLRPARVHEAEGPLAWGFAAITCAMRGGNLMWIRPGWRRDGLLPQALAPILPPERLLLARTPDETATLAVAEEALKDGALASVVVEITRPLSLREGRRLQLAASAGGTTGLCLIPWGMGSVAAETRWHCAPAFGSGVMRWEMFKNKSGTTGAWHLRWNESQGRVEVMSRALPVAGLAGRAASRSGGVLPPVAGNAAPLSERAG